VLQQQTESFQLKYSSGLCCLWAAAIFSRRHRQYFLRNVGSTVLDDTMSLARKNTV